MLAIGQPAGRVALGPAPADRSVHHAAQRLAVTQRHRHVADEGTISRAKAVQSCTNVAPVRIDSGKGPNHFMFEPLANSNRPAPTVKAALSFWPALNFPFLR